MKRFHAKTLTIPAALFVCIVAAVLLSFGCGGSSSSLPDPSADISDYGERIIMSDAYAGYLVLHVDESIGARLDASKTLMATSNDDGGLTYIQETIDAHPGATLRRSVDIDADKLDALRTKLEAQSGKTLADFNSIFKIDTPDLEEAVSFYYALKGKIGVSRIYPAQKTSPSSITTVPDLSGHQGYLYPESTDGGLNAEAAWNAGITGQGARVADLEAGWNYDHEDLPLQSDWMACPLTSTDEGCKAAIAHGTAVAGIVASIHNGNGTDGFAPDVQLDLFGISDATFSVENRILDALDGDSSNRELYPGDIMFIETSTSGVQAVDELCMTDQHGCLPVSIMPMNYDAIEYAIAAGITVIEGAGNGYVDLGDTANYGTTYKNISTNDSGSIIVGASLGANKSKADFSNWGSRVNVFAWGAGVVAPGFPYSGNPLDWSGGTPPSPANNEINTYYTNKFGGTSSATAMIAGAAALIQSYFKQQLGEPDTRYMLPLKMREILVNSGVSQTGGGGNIGKQPRIDIAMGLVDSLVANTKTAYPALASNDELSASEVALLRGMGIGIMCGEVDAENHVIVGANDPSCPVLNLWPEGNYISKPYDFDGDGRADLVKFRNGWWHVDLSSKGGDADGFGAWDIAAQFHPMPNSELWPYVTDMNSDGRCDFVMYDKLDGKFYVALTDNDLIENNVWHGWDWMIDYSSQWQDEYTVDPNNAKYSRPHIADYNGDDFVDIGITCSDGMLRLDYGDGTEAGFGAYEITSQLLSDDLLAQAPGWAYLVAPVDQPSNASVSFLVKVPDTHPDEGRMYWYGLKDGHVDLSLDVMAYFDAPYIFGGNDFVPFGGRFEGGEVAIKNEDWLIAAPYLDALNSVPPAGIYGGQECHPVMARFDYSSVDDRAVMCPDEWRFEYFTDEFDALLAPDGARHVPLTYNPLDHELPGRTYAGGISYEYALQLMQEYQAQHPGEPVPIMVDMITMTSGN